MKQKRLKKLIKQNRYLGPKQNKGKTLIGCCLCKQPSNENNSKFVIINTSKKQKIELNKPNVFYANFFLEYMLKKRNKKLSPNFVFVFTICVNCYEKDVYTTYCYFLDPPPTYYHYDSKYIQYLKLKYYNRRTRTLSVNFYYAYSLVSSIIKSNGEAYMFERKLWEKKA